jgi:hypothetical protein
MSWSTELANPIALKDGRLIATLGRAREMMFSIPPPRRRLAADLRGRQRIGNRPQRSIREYPGRVGQELLSKLTGRALDQALDPRWQEPMLTELIRGL